MDLFCKSITPTPKYRSISAAKKGEKLGNEHWLKVYDYRMNEKGYVLRSDVKLAP